MALSFGKLAKAASSLLVNPLFVNAYVEKLNGRVCSVNWGDDINDHFIRLLSGREVEIYFDTPVAMALKRPNFLCIGSTLNYLTTPQTIVWGAGVIDDTLDLRAQPARVTAVRGPLTRDFLLARGIDCPEVYGDPALLIPYFYKPAPAERGPGRKMGIVPHYKDQTSPIFAAIRRAHPELEFIDIANYGTWTDFIDRVSACDVVFSSSLHGLIVAEAFGIPNQWVKITDNVLGQGFKFRDFFASVGKPVTAPIELDDNWDPRAFLAAQTWRPGRINLEKLLAACPFEIREPIRHEHPLDL
ncbi:polysaccharide pyruvyl transferase family protein [Vulcanococcus limneticus Candia 3F8]|uniref:polysaccharide pyruvyl transferase family protein n=1 Tax=Vulcanococcus limneticus TaxID=2170428 RepID=UPI000B994ADC|nr:polysaccharide pyruvyl transferase family protein [Vulcanococcus limneticus]MCP9791140.1 polysaccharide pyruvyl transferase family protein [Vulcanococcus limneticus MW73D5]MCP9893710.1 polysaccharide pyruvyl transferase family protein [Vulcanococcus limneticus Candia 3F8]MCP9896538.1 polysaccharide pyruvyl transferase family protein [Vulcanococcus limneticus Candia 3B3]